MGVGFLIEAAPRIVIAYNVSPGTALAISKLTPFLFIGLLSAWTVGYGARQRRKGERMAAPADEDAPAAIRAADD